MLSRVNCVAGKNEQGKMSEKLDGSKRELAYGREDHSRSPSLKPPGCCSCCTYLEDGPLLRTRVGIGKFLRSVLLFEKYAM